jgi:hypothetical protein
MTVYAILGNYLLFQDNPVDIKRTTHLYIYSILWKLLGNSIPIVCWNFIKLFPN